MADVRARKDGKSKKAAKAESELQELMAKAIRRGDKLSRTLTQIVTQTKLDPSHPVHALLKALDKNMSKLRLHGEAQEQRDGAAKVTKRKATPESTSVCPSEIQWSYRGLAGCTCTAEQETRTSQPCRRRSGPDIRTEMTYPSQGAPARREQIAELAPGQRLLRGGLSRAAEESTGRGCRN